MTSENAETPDALTLIVAALVQAGVKATPENVTEAVKAVLAQWQRDQATAAALRQAHRGFVTACTCR